MPCHRGQAGSDEVATEARDSHVPALSVLTLDQRYQPVCRLLQRMRVVPSFRKFADSSRLFNSLSIIKNVFVILNLSFKAVFLIKLPESKGNQQLQGHLQARCWPLGNQADSGLS